MAQDRDVSWATFPCASSPLPVVDAHPPRRRRGLLLVLVLEPVLLLVLVLRLVVVVSNKRQKKDKKEKNYLYPKGRQRRPLGLFCASS